MVNVPHKREGKSTAGIDLQTNGKPSWSKQTYFEELISKQMVSRHGQSKPTLLQLVLLQILVFMRSDAPCPSN